MLIVWSIVEIVVVVVLFLFTVPMVDEMSRQMAAEASQDRYVGQDEIHFMEFVLYASNGCWSLVGFVLPILFLSFLNTPVKRKEIQGWRIAG